MEIYYVNHKNEKIDFMSGCYSVESSSFFSHSWDYETQELQKYGEKITRIKKGLKNHKMTLHIESQGLVSCDQAYNDLFDVFEADIFAEIPGKLYVEDSYINCYVIKNSPRYFVPGIDVISCELGFVMPRPFWISEQKIVIDPMIIGAISSEDDDLSTYPYTYPHKYPVLQTETIAYIDHYKESDFQLTIHGPCTSVAINIADYPYEVSYSLEKEEYMVIDSRSFVEKERRLYVVRKNGNKESIFNYRSVENSVFKKIPSGTIRIDYPRAHGLELVIYKERSEPPWKS